MTDPVFVAFIAAIATVTGAIIGSGTSLVGVWVNARNESKRRVFEAQVKEAEERRWRESQESEERHWYLSFYLPRQVEALTNLYAALMDCTHSINTIHNYPTLVFPMWYSDVYPKLEAFSKAVSLSYVYLEDRAKPKLLQLNNALNAYSDAVFFQGMPNKEMPQTMDLTGLREMWGEVIEYIEGILKATVPESLKKTK